MTDYSPPKAYESKQRFSLTEVHIALLSQARVSWNGEEFGAPTIDPKRPYGNGDAYDDMAKILNIKRGPDGEFASMEISLMDVMHSQTQTALQILLIVGHWEPGEYEADRYMKNWKRI